MRVLLKITGVLLVLLTSFLFGYLKSLSFTKRLSELKKILGGSERLKEHILNCPSEIEIIYTACYGKCSDIEYKNGKIRAKQGAISKQDCDLLNEFFITLGTFDLKSECAHINLYIELIKKLISSAELEANEGSKIWQTCSICAGICISILII